VDAVRAWQPCADVEELLLMGSGQSMWQGCLIRVAAGMVGNQAIARVAGAPGWHLPP
jgi:hypothetical protein